MFETTMPPNWGLLLVQDRESRIDAAVHMFWMRFDLAVVWLDADFVVVDARLARRWQPFLMPRRSARYILETHVKHINRYAIGDQLALEETAPA